jgi:uncharacterized membrane protein YadS
MKVIKRIFSGLLNGLLTIAETGALFIFIFYCGVWAQMTHSETMPFTSEEIEKTVIPIFILLWIVISIINGLREQRWKKPDNKEMETI